MDQFALEPGRNGFQFKIQGTRSDNGDFVMRGGDRAVFPAIESNRDLGVAGADRLWDPNQAV